MFICIYSFVSLRGMNDPHAYYLNKAVQDQFLYVEYPEHFAPTWGKHFDELTTVEEFYQWLQGPFINAVFSSHTFDGDEKYKAQGGRPMGRMLGYNQFVGAVRISQLRVNKEDCSDSIPLALKQNYTWECYGRPGVKRLGKFSLEDENRSAFGNFGLLGGCSTNDYANSSMSRDFGGSDDSCPFLFNGRNGHTGAPLVPSPFYKSVKEYRKESEVQNARF